MTDLADAYFGLFQFHCSCSLLHLIKWSNIIVDGASCAETNIKPTTVRGAALNRLRTATGTGPLTLPRCVCLLPTSAGGRAQRPAANSSGGSGRANAASLKAAVQASVPSIARSAFVQPLLLWHKCRSTQMGSNLVLWPPHGDK